MIKDDRDQYAEIRGTATVTEDVDRLLAVAPAEDHEGTGAGQEYLDRPAEVVRVVLRITPQRVTRPRRRLNARVTAPWRSPR